MKKMLIAIVASAVISLMVAAGGLTDVSVTEDGCLVGEMPVCAPPDPLTICRDDVGRVQCVKEPT